MRVVAGQLERIAGILERSGVRYAVIGGHAVNGWLEPRFTADIDVTVAISAEELNELLGVLEAEGLAIE